MDGSLPRGGQGRPHEPTDERRQHVAVLRANGIPLRIIAEMLQISLPTLRVHYKPALRRGYETVRAAISVALVKAALSGNVHAMKYWLMTRGGPEWRMIEGREFGWLPPPEGPVPEVRLVPVWPTPREEGD
jgi:hypothetical protein